MPLHLLGKKSWNVYNPENIARVRQDEAAAQAQNEQQEREERNAETATRLRSLRGDESADLTPRNLRDKQHSRSASQNRDVSRTKRKLKGEDDTDRDIRLARHDTERQASRCREPAVTGSKEFADVILERRNSQNNSASLEKPHEIGGMRFKDAAGYGSTEAPWYTAHQAKDTTRPYIGKDVWGNEDPRRHEREQKRVSANDPLTAMKKGIRHLRENEKHRKEWLEQREKDLYEVERLARAQGRKRKEEHSDEASLEHFSLDGPPDAVGFRSMIEKHNSDKRREKGHRRHKYRYRSRSPDRAGRGRHQHYNEYHTT